MKLVLLIVFTTLSNLASSQDLFKYKVVDIDSTKSTYLIKVKHKKHISVIESPKKNLSSSKSDRKIILGKTYKLRLEKSRLTTGLSFYTTIYFDDKKVWSTDSDFELVTTKNINGLHISKSY